MESQFQSWFAVRVRQRSEKKGASYLEQTGFTVCLPTYISERRWSDRIKRLELPLFPGYFFCQMDLAKRVDVLNAPGVVQIVGFGKTPVPVDAREMESVLRSIQTGVHAEPAPLPHAGARVMIRSGPLRGLEGVIVEGKKRNKIILCVTLLQRAIAVELDDSDIFPIGIPTMVFARNPETYACWRPNDIGS